MARASTRTTNLVAYVSERLVESYAVVGSGWRLSGYHPGADVDGKDVVLDELGGSGVVYLQVKVATHLDAAGRVDCRAAYRESEIPESPRLLYVFGYLDSERIEVDPLWLVHSQDFNRLVVRHQSPDARAEIQLHFRSRPRGRDRWTPFRVDRLELGRRLLEVERTAPRVPALKLPALRLIRA